MLLRPLEFIVVFVAAQSLASYRQFDRPKLQLYAGHLALNDYPSPFPENSSPVPGAQYTLEFLLESTFQYDYMIESCDFNDKFRFMTDYGCLICGSTFTQSWETKDYATRGLAKRTLVHVEYPNNESDFEVTCRVKVVDCQGCCERSCVRRPALNPGDTQLVVITLNRPQITIINNGNTYDSGAAGSSSSSSSSSSSGWPSTGDYNPAHPNFDIPPGSPQLGGGVYPIGGGAVPQPPPPPPPPPNNNNNYPVIPTPAPQQYPLPLPQQPYQLPPSPNQQQPPPPPMQYAQPPAGYPIAGGAYPIGGGSGGGYPIGGGALPGYATPNGYGNTYGNQHNWDHWSGLPAWLWVLIGLTILLLLLCCLVWLIFAICSSRRSRQRKRQQQEALVATTTTVEQNGNPTLVKTTTTKDSRMFRTPDGSLRLNAADLQRQNETIVTEHHRRNVDFEGVHEGEDAPEVHGYPNGRRREYENGGVYSVSGRRNNNGSGRYRRSHSSGVAPAENRDVYYREDGYRRPATAFDDYDVEHEKRTTITRTIVEEQRSPTTTTLTIPQQAAPRSYYESATTMPLPPRRREFADPIAV